MSKFSDYLYMLNQGKEMMKVFQPPICYFQQTIKTVRSSYSSGNTMSKLNIGLVDALINYIAAEKGIKGKHCALGKADNNVIVEYEEVPNITTLVRYDLNNKIMYTSVVDSMGNYKEVQFKRGYESTGAPYFLALFPTILEDEEANNAYNEFKTYYSTLENGELTIDHSLRDKANECLAIFCDNVERRLKSDKIVVNIPRDGNIKKLSKEDVEEFIEISNVINGAFEHFEKNRNVIIKPTNVTVGYLKEYYDAGMEWTEEEELLIPSFPDNMIVPDEVIELLDYIKESSNDLIPVRNALWRGETGFGKSTGVKLIACLRNVPLKIISCFPDMETSDFLINFVPVTDEDNIKNIEELDVTYEEISFDPVTAYKKLTGIDDDNATCEMALKAYGIACSKVNASETPKFKSVLSDYVVGLSKGYIVEIQEPSIILKSGVLAGLNEYDHEGAVIPLSDGTYKRRHKEAIVIWTDNVTYEGCRPLNQSMVRRNFLCIDSYNMSKDVIFKRIKDNTKFRDIGSLERMYSVWENIKEFCKNQSITDGSISIIELQNWAQAASIRGTSNEALRQTCLRTVVSKATAYIDEQESIIASCLDIEFPPKGIL